MDRAIRGLEETWEVRFKEWAALVSFAMEHAEELRRSPERMRAIQVSLSKYQEAMDDLQREERLRRRKKDGQDEAAGIVRIPV